MMWGALSTGLNHGAGLADNARHVGETHSEPSVPEPNGIQ